MLTENKGEAAGDQLPSEVLAGGKHVVPVEVDDVPCGCTGSPGHSAAALCLGPVPWCLAQTP